MMMKPVSMERTRDAYLRACSMVGMHPDGVPVEFINLSALASRFILDAFCEENGLELPEESLDDSLKRLMDAGVITEAEAARIRDEMCQGGPRN